MNSILKMSVALTPDVAVSEKGTAIPKIQPEVTEFVLFPQQIVAGPEILKRSPRRFELPIPAGWQDVREKAIAALRRTIAGAALEVGREIKPSIVYVTDVDLCGLAGVLVSRSFSCPLVLGLSADDVEIGLFDERKVSILDSCITAAKAVVVTGEETASLLRGYYPSLRDRIGVVKGVGFDDLGVEKLIQSILHEQHGVPWTRQPGKPLPVSRPRLVGSEIIYVEEVLLSGWWGYGPVARCLEELFVQWCGPDSHALALSSCTAALHLALIAAGIGPGDEVIVPALTFVSTATAVVQAGATPRFADVDPSTLSLAPEAVEHELSSKTRAVIPVHFAGVPTNVRSIEQVVRGWPIVIIEDAAHAMGAERDDCRVGSRFPFTCFSFAPTKQVPSCAGGMLVFRDGSLTSQLRELSNVGLRVDTHQRSVLHGAGPANEVVCMGYRYRMNDVTAAIAVAQFQQLEEIMSHRAALVARYYHNLSSVEGCELIKAPDSAKPSWYIMPIRVSSSIRDALRDHLADEGIDTSVHYPSLSEQPAFRDMPGSAPVASREARRLISLPLHQSMTVNDVDRACSIIADYILTKCEKR
ncbi:DegT/DnrJ/EryC1/StrS aminotransferase family protein [Dehalococcoidia bacterium]|nr:DegT/DnrJ/EryC1/StrS aminotransferase family protein [Dehalococcoidia bacterium]